MLFFQICFVLGVIGILGLLVGVITNNGDLVDFSSMSVMFIVLVAFMVLLGNTVFVIK